jgi:hypothetical protein
MYLIYKAATKAASPNAPNATDLAIAVCIAPASEAVVALPLFALPLCALPLCALPELVSRSSPTAVGTISPPDVIEVVYVTLPPELSGVGMAGM